ncbi:MAG: UDP-N-acetylmuramate dehydrogenase [Lachnospiraceae bacterium]|nr:UDP-N-acetylmuramate dehydrogenase [Lachnospiraceae bacterium]
MFQIQRLEQIVGRDRIRSEEPLSEHTTFRIGGPAKWYVEADTTEELVLIVRYLREQREPYHILGNGSNVLVEDAGIDGVVVCTHNGRGGSLESVGCFTEEQEMRRFFYDQGYCVPEEVQGRILLYAGGGALLSQIASQAAKESLTGLEFAGGIPGTLGGAVTMNAGAYGGEIQDVIVAARILDQNGIVKILKKEELELGYRSSIIQRENMLVLDALFALEPGEEQQIRATMKDYNERRREKQPLEYGSAGSTFKRPEGYFAGKLIQDAGLRGYRVGDVMVSEKHCGFVVNVGQGNCEQAKQVIEHVQKTVFEQFGVELETEIKVW